jgi:hypothetical protein
MGDEEGKDKKTTIKNEKKTRRRKKKGTQKAKGD